MQYRQGDLLIELVDSIATNKTTANNLLARGEGRNHGHFIEGDVTIYEAPQPEKLEIDTEIVTHFIEVQTKAELKHLLIDSRAWTKEHHPITLPPGKYKVIRQKEYNPYLRAIRILKD